MLFSFCITSFIIAVLSASTKKPHIHVNAKDVIKSNFNGTEYSYITKRRSYDIAVNQCKKNGLTLLTIPNKHVQDHLEQNLPKLLDCKSRSSGMLKLFIGLTDKYENGTWWWSDGTMLQDTGFENWDENCKVRSETDNGCQVGPATRHAVIEACDLDKMGNWSRDPNQMKRFYICQRKRNESEQNTVNSKALSSSSKKTTDKTAATEKKSPTTMSTGTSSILVPTSKSPKSGKRASQKPTSKTSNRDNSGSASLSKNETAKRQKSRGKDRKNYPKKSEVTVPTSRSSDNGKGISGFPQSPVLVQPTLPDSEPRPPEYENSINENGLTRQKNGNDSTTKPLQSWSTWYPLLDNGNATSSPELSIHPSASIAPGSAQGNNNLKPGDSSLENMVAMILECLHYRYNKEPPLSERMLWFCRRNMEMEESESLGTQTNMIELWENKISATVADKLFASNHENEITITSVAGIEVQLIPLTLEERSYGRAFSPKKTVVGENSVEIRQEDINHIEGDVVIINAMLKKAFLKNAGILHLYPLTGLEESSEHQKEYEKYLSEDSVVMSVSVYQHSGREGDRAEKISIPTSLQFDSTKDKTSMVVQEMRERRITEITHQCVYLNHDKNEWSMDGCNTTGHREGITKCHCNHTTAFAVMVSMRSIKVPEWEEILIMVLEIFTVIFLALTLAIILWIRSSLRKDRVLTQINLVFSLLCFHVFSLVGSPSLSINRLCEAVTVFSHFFLVASAMWMFNEGFVLYKKSCGDALNFDITKLRRLLFALGWCFPALFVLLCAGIGLGLERYLDITLGFQNFFVENVYHDQGYPVVKKYERCWLGVNSLMILTAILPIAFSLICNIFILIRVSQIVWKMSIQTQSMRPSMSDKPKQERRGHLKATFKALTLLIPVLGIPWVFAFFVNIPGSETIFIAIHGIMNGLQGEFIFLIYVCLNREVRFTSKRKLMSKSTFATSVSNLTPMTKRRKTIPTVSKSTSHGTSV